MSENENEEDDTQGLDDWEDEGGAGVSEPRRSPPSKGGSSAEAEPERMDEPALAGATGSGSCWYF